MDLDILFGGNSDNSTDLDTIDTDAEVQDVEEAAEDAPEENGIGWKVLALFICGGLVITALAVAFMVWVIEGLVL
ncbi:hypothetical protein C8D88_10915 [Lentzea atacamensis]|uniref:Uncharacterized protein n=1 Tax=Lentzea atacamensis TaxID=531938 RepID=A0A316HV11_9PSEU|nr:hypothetical protein [Lentzea atacamensis]PWK83935.1 hypothetical protein C8D88_10915 [Lentzea atacamensis]RAS68799.1 hypothetical protein C8D87_102872 [Lentzea atacamensis]